MFHQNKSKRLQEFNYNRVGQRTAGDPPRFDLEPTLSFSGHMMTVLVSIIT